MFSSCNTHSQPFLLTVSYIQRISGCIVRSNFQLQHYKEKNSGCKKCFDTTGVCSNDAKVSLPGLAWVQLLPYQISLNFKIFCHLAEINSIPKFAENVDTATFASQVYQFASPKPCQTHGYSPSAIDQVWQSSLEALNQLKCRLRSIFTVCKKNCTSNECFAFVNSCFTYV